MWEVHSTKRARVALEKVWFGGESPTFLFRDNFLLKNENNGHILSTFYLSLLQQLVLPFKPMNKEVQIIPKGIIWSFSGLINHFYWRESIFDLLKILPWLVDPNVPLLWPFNLGNVLNIYFIRVGQFSFGRLYHVWYFINPKITIWVLLIICFW